MEDFKTNREPDKEIIFSKSVRAGKRIYYVDVKKNKKGELFIALTESKKIVSNDTDTPAVNFEKHKIFLYHEDFEKFMASLQEAMDYICREQPDIASHSECKQPADDTTGEGLHIDMDLNMDELGLEEKTQK